MPAPLFSLVFHRIAPAANPGLPPDTVFRQVVHRTVVAPIHAELGSVRFTAYGNVMTPDSIPLRNARVTLSWADTSRTTVSQTRMDLSSDAGGVFVFCGVPHTRQLLARVVVPDGTVFDGTTWVPGPEGTTDNSLRTLTLIVAPERPEAPPGPDRPD